MYLHNWYYHNKEIYYSFRYCSRCCKREELLDIPFTKFIKQYIKFDKHNFWDLPLLEYIVFSLGDFFGHFGPCKDRIILYPEDKKL